MPNKLKSAKPALQAFLLDYCIWLYVFASIYYLFLRWTDTSHTQLREQVVASIFHQSGWLATHFITLSIFIFPLLIALIFTIVKDSLGLSLFRPEAIKEKKSLFQVRRWLGIFLIVLTVVLGWVLVEVQPGKFFMNFRNAKGIVSGIFHPNYAILNEMLFALVQTILLALMATVIAIPFAFVLSFLAAQNLMKKHWLGHIVYVLVRTISTVFRSIEAIVWAIIFSVWVGIGPFAGMLALMIHSVASLVKLYSEQIENIDKGPVEAIRATGASTLQIWRYAVIPQILAPFLAFTIYRWDINVRMATIVGFVGGGGIGLALQQQQQMLAWRSVGLIMWLIAIVVWIMDMVSAQIRQRLLDS